MHLRYSSSHAVSQSSAWSGTGQLNKMLRTAYEYFTQSLLTFRSSHHPFGHKRLQLTVKKFSFQIFEKLLYPGNSEDSESQAAQRYLKTINTIWNNITQMSCWSTVRGFDIFRWMIFWIHNFIFQQGVIHKSNQWKLKWSHESKWRKKLLSRWRSWPHSRWLFGIRYAAYDTEIKRRDFKAYN